jgi:hypothetical protein
MVPQRGVIGLGIVRCVANDAGLLYPEWRKGKVVHGSGNGPRHAQLRGQQQQRSSDPQFHHFSRPQTNIVELLAIFIQLERLSFPEINPVETRMQSRKRALIKPIPADAA